MPEDSTVKGLLTEIEVYRSRLRSTEDENGRLMHALDRIARHDLMPAHEIARLALGGDEYAVGVRDL